VPPQLNHAACDLCEQTNPKRVVTAGSDDDRPIRGLARAQQTNRDSERRSSKMRRFVGTDAQSVILSS
jgi:hypothetical protein